MIVERGRVIGLRRGEESARSRDTSSLGEASRTTRASGPGPPPSRRRSLAAGPDPMVDAARRLRGNFFLSIRDVANGRTVAFTDSGGMFDAYDERRTRRDVFPPAGGDDRSQTPRRRPRCGRRVSRSRQGLRGADAAPGDPASPARHGLRAARWCDHPVTHDLGMPGIDAGPDAGFTLELFFEELASSLAGLNVSVDLTGGSDTRLVAADARTFPAVRVCGLGHGQLERRGDRRRGRPCPRTSASRDDPRRVRRRRRGRRAVRGGGRHLRRPDRASAPPVRTRTGGPPDRRRRRRHRWGVPQGLLLAARLPASIDRRTPHFERLFDTRFRPVAFPPGLLADRFAPHAAEVRPRILAAMRRRRMATNTETYDRIYYEMRMAVVAAHAISVNDNYVPFVAPLLDPAIVRLGYSLPRRDRFFNRYHRRLITDASLAVARVPSSDTGVTRMSLSSRPRDELRDAPVYVLDKLRRAPHEGRPASRDGRSGTQRSTIPRSSLRHARARPSGARWEAWCRPVSCRRLRQGDLPDRYVGRVMTLGMLFERLDG